MWAKLKMVIFKCLVLLLIGLAPFTKTYSASCTEETSLECNFEPRTQISVGHTYIRGESPTAEFALITDVYNLQLEVGIAYIAESKWRDQITPKEVGLNALLVKRRGRFEFGGGLTYLTHKSPYNGSHVNFSLLVRYCFTDRLSLTLDNHWSNGGLQPPNPGRDRALLNWRF